MKTAHEAEPEDQPLPEEKPRNILITGCSSGIGLTCALGMKARGWRVLATARTKEDLAMLHSKGLEALQLDYAKPNTIETCVTYTLWHTGGKLDALFNNGGYGQMGAVEDLTTDMLRAQFEANFFGWHELTRRLIPSMRKNQSGRIIQCSSMLGFVAAPFRGAYCASKHALQGLTEAMRYELAGSGIHVSLIEPGPIKSKFLETAIENFKQTIDAEHSVHKDVYEKKLSQLKNGKRSFVKLNPEAVLKKLIHATESKKPKSHYYVTAPAYLAAFGKRLLPQFMADKFLRNA